MIVTTFQLSNEAEHRALMRGLADAGQPGTWVRQAKAALQQALAAHGRALAHAEKALTRPMYGSSMFAKPETTAAWVREAEAKLVLAEAAFEAACEPTVRLQPRKAA